jgi:GT2 family glycosyltransferase
VNGPLSGNGTADPRVRTGALAQVGIVAIGRNEGERLRRCIASLPDGVAGAVYVDSASTDGSVEHARERGVEVVELDMSVPFTAARARNAGIARLRQLAPGLPFVLVLDGDCELVEGFVQDALEVMNADAAIGVVCGRRREQHRAASVYNRLVDMEWNTKVGDTDACGGDALLRLAAFDAAGGYDDTLIAGEEPEMCLRMRRAGFRIRRIERDMTRHDAAMTRFAQWWKRSVRAGHACAEAAHLHPDDYFARRTVRSNVIWGFALPASALGLSAPSSGSSLGLFGLYGALWWRIRSYRMREHGDSAQDAALYATYCVLGKLPQFVGTAQFHANRLRGRRSALIEYKRS